MTIERIDPSFWYAGLGRGQLQLLVSGRGVGAVAAVSCSGQGVCVSGVVHLDSPDYLLVGLDISQAVAGMVTLSFDGQTVDYELCERRHVPQGFSSADVLYLLLPDRFAQSARHPAHIGGLRPYREDRRQPSLRHGGDLAGLCRHMDYFEQLGVTALWLTPVQENNSADSDGRFSTYHGYAITDYYRVDPRLGTLSDYRRLCDEAHRRGLKVVMDIVFNHCSIDHPWVANPPSADWLNGTPEHHVKTSYRLTPVADPYASDIDRRETVEGWFTDAMPDLNLRNRHLLRYLTQCTMWWVETAGIDGIRMDTYPYAHAPAMAEWAADMRREYPGLNIVGETWVHHPAYTAAWQQDAPAGMGSQLPTVMDFAFYDQMSQAKHEETDDWWQGLNRLYHTLCYDYLYARPDNVLAFIDNHDTDRFLGNGRQVALLKQALALLLTVKRTPQLYYGTEILLGGTAAETDGHVRQDFPGGFPGDRRSAFTPEGRTPAQNDMFRWLSRLLHWRRQHADVVGGRQKHFIPHKGVYVVARQSEADGCRGTWVLTVLNGTSGWATLEVARYGEVLRQASQAVDIPTGRTYSLTRDLRLRPRQSLVLEIVPAGSL